jgi:DNA-binding IclR family transcriptional regulator
MMQIQKNGGIQALARAVQVIKACEREGRGLSLGEIAGLVNLPRSTVQRIVQTLVAEGFLAAGHGAKSITLGPDLLAMGALASAQAVERALPLLKTLAQDTGETVDLAWFNRDHMVFLAQVPGSQRLQAVSAVGDAFPLHCTANGKAALALLPEGAAASLIATDLPRLTCHTITDAKALGQELDGIRETGMAHDREEHTLGISAIGMALRDRAQQIYAVSIPVPTVRFGEQRERCERALRETVAKLRTALATV